METSYACNRGYLNPLVGNFSDDTLKEEKRRENVTPLDWPSVHMRDCDSLKGSHMTKDSLASEWNQ